jgi:hypothetical protein
MVVDTLSFEHKTKLTSSLIEATSISSISNKIKVFYIFINIRILPQWIDNATF